MESQSPKRLRLQNGQPYKPPVPEFHSAFQDLASLSAHSSSHLIPDTTNARKRLYPPSSRFSFSDVSEPKRVASSSALHPLPLPFPLEKPSSKRTIPMTTVLKPPALETSKPRSRPPPSFFASSASKNLTPLKFLPPPPLPASTTSPKKEMKTISTTRVARAIDPSTDAGHAELLSISLQLHSHTFVPTQDRELSRGIFLSPEKADRPNGRKFLRDGLAEHANHLISRSQTAFSLWQKETGSLVRLCRRLYPDLRLHIIKILHVVHQANRFRSSPVPRSGLALCRKSSAPGGGDELLTVLFTFAPPASTNERISTAEDFKENNEVCIWRPWNEHNEDGGRRTLMCTRFYLARSS